MMSSTRSSTAAASPPSAQTAQQSLTSLPEEEEIIIDESMLSGEDDTLSDDEPVRRRSHRPRVEDEAMHLDPNTDPLIMQTNRRKFLPRRTFAISFRGPLRPRCAIHASK
jgi:hypothetical protein